MARRPKKGARVTVMPKRKGQRKISFKAGGEHASTGTPMGEKIPASKRAAARSGKLGVKAERQEIFRENILKGRGKGRKRGHAKRR